MCIRDRAGTGHEKPGLDMRSRELTQVGTRRTIDWARKAGTGHEQPGLDMNSREWTQAGTGRTRT
eukprot:11363972-Alexandrium_andersonii.AAC.1